MAKFKNRFEVACSVENEGLVYFIQNYCRSDSMPDEETEKAFSELDEAILKFNELIGLE
jgi:hypothetical protein